IEDGRLRLQMLSAPDPRLLGWLNVRYLVMDRLRDRWIDGVYYDLGVSQTLAPDQSVVLPVDPAFPSTSLGIGVAASDNGAPSGALRVEASGAQASDANGGVVSVAPASGQNLP